MSRKIYNEVVKVGITLMSFQEIKCYVENYKCIKDEENVNHLSFKSCFSLSILTHNLVF